MGLRSAESSAAKSSSYMRGSAGNSLMSRSATASLERPHELDLSIGNKYVFIFNYYIFLISGQASFLLM